MENLLANYHDKFFPNESTKLIILQISIEGISIDFKFEMMKKV